MASFHFCMNYLDFFFLSSTPKGMTFTLQMFYIEHKIKDEIARGNE